MEVVIAPRFNGPKSSANGGYTCGVVARLVGADTVQVTLRLPPPLGRPLVWAGRQLRDGGAVVAEAEPVGPLTGDAPPPVTFEDATRALPGYAGFGEHAFPTCFVCGPERRPGDGLRVFASPVGEGLVAAPWRPDAGLAEPEGRRVDPEFAWAALDCPGAFAVGLSARGETVLGRMAAELRRPPEPGEPCVVVARPAGEDGRKLYAETALYSGDELLGRARQTWIAPRDA